MKPINTYTSTDHGSVDPSTFQPEGIAGTMYADNAVGVGDTRAKAIDAAIDNIASKGYDAEPLRVTLKSAFNKSALAQKAQPDQAWHFTLMVV